jgi:hypothetical protein
VAIMTELTDDGLSCISSNMDGEQELQRPAQTKQHIAEGAGHVNFAASQQIKWQREVLAILERISTCAEAIEGARALLTSLLEAQAREQDHDRIRASFDCDLDSPSTALLAQPVDQRNDLEAQAQGEQDDRTCSSLDCNLHSPSTIPLGRPVDHRNEGIGVSGIARPCADRPPVQLEAKPEYVSRLVRAAVAWFSDLVSRAGSRSRN